jgi:hypothetical protein
MSAKKAIQKLKDDAAQAETRGFLEDLFDDYYRQRYKVYKMNLIRGVFFGFGSVIGGTLMIALLLWLLTFTNDIPFIGDFSQKVQNSIESRKGQPVQQQ